MGARKGRGKKIPTYKKEEVIELKLKHPDITLRELEKKTGINYKVCKDILDTIPEKVKESNISQELGTLKKIDNIINSITNITKQHIEDVEEKIKEKGVKPKDLKIYTEISKVYHDRKQILEGKPTEIIDHNVNFEDMSLKELEEYKKNLLG